MSGSRERGVTLIDSLIALLVLSIALLGVGALQLMTQREEVEARWRSVAVSMSGNLIEQLRTDRVAAEGLGLTNGVPTGCMGPNQWMCDLIDGWLASLHQQLPNASAQLKIKEVGDNFLKAELAIAWRRVGDGDAEENCLPMGGDSVELVEGGCLRLETVL